MDDEDSTTNKETMELIIDDMVKAIEKPHGKKNNPLDVIDRETLLHHLMKGLQSVSQDTDLTANNLRQLEQSRRNTQGITGTDTAVVPQFDIVIQSRRYKLLDKIRINCVNLASYHNHRHHVYKNILFTIFRVPLILLNGLNSFFSVGLQAYMAQGSISLMTAIVSLFCGILTSIELLLNLQKRMEMEQESAKSYYRLSVEIYAELAKSLHDRGVDGDLRDFLKSKYNEYQNLFTSSNTVNMGERNFIDEFELYIEPENADSDNVKMETGTNYEGSFHAFPQDEFCSDDSDPLKKTGHRITETNSSSICPVCCRNLMSSCLMTIFYCCVSGENQIERVTKRERRARHTERKNKYVISKNRSTIEMFDFV
jgi:hypothetical protein